MMNRKIKILFLLIFIHSIYFFPLTFKVFKIQDPIFLSFDNKNIETGWIQNGTVICNASNLQAGSIPLIDSDGFIWITWSDKRKDDGDIYVQKLNPNGSSCFQDNGIPIFNDNNKSFYARTISDGNGGIVTTWYDNRTGQNEVYIQRVNSLGQLLWGPNGKKIVQVTSTQEGPQIVNISNDFFVIVWEDNRTGNKDIYAQKIDLQGNLLWGEGIAVCNATNDQILFLSKKSITSTSHNEVAVTWRDYRDDINGDIYTQLLNASGYPQWKKNGTAVCNIPSSYQRRPLIDNINDENFIIAWWDRRNNTIRNTDIYAQMLNLTGDPQWEPNGSIIVSEEKDQYLEQLCTYENKIFFSWQDDRDDPNGDIYLHEFNLTGPVLDLNGTICSNVSGEEDTPLIVISDNYLFVSWQDWELGSEIFLMKYHLNGTRAWISPYQVVNGTNALYNENIIADGMGGIILSWIDNRDDPNGDLYMLRLNSSGGIWVPPPSNGGSEPPPDIRRIVILVLAITLPVAGVGAAGVAILIVRRRRQAPTKMPPKKAVPQRKLPEDQEQVLKNICTIMALIVVIKKE